MIDDQTVYYLLDHIACEVMFAMRDHGKTPEEIDEGVLPDMRKKDRIAVYERVVHFWGGEFWGGEEVGVTVAAHLRALKRGKRSSRPTPPPQPTPPPATILH
jgi:hypothetical protein